MEIFDYASVKKWLSRVGKGSHKIYKLNFRLFMNWLPENGGKFADMNPNELVAYMEEANRKAAFALLDKVQEFAQSWKGLREKTLKSRYGAVRSFFLHNRVELPKDPSFTLRPDVMPVKGKLKLEDISLDSGLLRESTPILFSSLPCTQSL